MSAEEAALLYGRALARARRRAARCAAPGDAGQELRALRRDAARSRCELQALADRVAGVVCATIEEAVPLARVLAEARRTLDQCGPRVL